VWLGRRRGVRGGGAIRRCLGKLAPARAACLDQYRTSSISGAPLNVGTTSSGGSPRSRHTRGTSLLVPPVYDSLDVPRASPGQP